MENTQPKPYVSIKNWAEDDKPREKLLSKGRGALSDAELMAILLGSGTKTKSAVELAQEILSNNHNSLIEIGRQSVKQLMQFKGIGEAKAITIVAALELSRRRRGQDLPAKPKITSSQQAFEYILPVLADLDHEQFWVILISQSNQIIAKKQISSGGVTGTVADAKLIFKAAIEHAVPNIIICHNHPSGNLKPSASDDHITRKIFEGGKNLDIKLLDHIIVAGTNYFSYADEGRL